MIDEKSMTAESRGRKMLKRLVIGDIDGVVADCSHRLKYITGTDEEKDYDKFYGAEMACDGYINRVGRLLGEMTPNEYTQLIFLTGRPEKTRELTRLWLNTHFDKHYWLSCRHDGDHRASRVVKAEMVHQLLKRFEPFFAKDMEILIFDDDISNIEAMTEVVKAESGYEVISFLVNAGDSSKSAQTQSIHVCHTGF